MTSNNESETADRTLAQSDLEADLDGSLFQLPIRCRQTQVTDTSTNTENQTLIDAGVQEPWHVLHPTKGTTTNYMGSIPSQLKDQVYLADMAFERLACADPEGLAACLDAGALIEHEDGDGITLLVTAIIESNVAITRLLLQRGADPQHRSQGKPPLFHAVRDEKHGPVLIRLLLDYGASISTNCGMQRMNALHWAAADGTIDSVDFLLSQGIDIDATCTGEHTALHVAAGTGHLTVVKLLLTQGANIAKRGELGENIMMVAAAMGHVDIVKLCLEEGMLVDNCDDKGLTALLSACELGATAVVDYLLEKGADVNAASTCKSTPALKAAAQGHIETFRVLISKGAKLSCMSSQGANVLEIAISKGHADMVRLILSTLGGPSYPLESVSLEIASARRLDAIRSLMKSASLMHAHIEQRSETPPHCAWVKWVLDTGGHLVRPQALSNMILVAIADADLSLIKALLLIGADPNEFSLSTAVVNQKLDIVQLLLDHGAGPKSSARCIKGPDGRPENVLLDGLLNIPYQKETCLTILQALLDSGRFNVLEGPSSNQTAFWRVLKSDDWDPKLQHEVAFMMLNSVIDFNYTCNGDGGTLMHHVVRYGREDMVDYLLEKGANINAQDNEGRTPFILACDYQPKMIPFLLERGADPNLLYEDGRGPLHAAATAGNCVTLESLWVQGPVWRDTDQSSRDGWTPLACALAADQENAALFLIERGANMKHTVAANGRTMLHLASAFGHERVLERIVSLGDIDVNGKDNIKDSTPLLLACAGTRYKSGSTKIVRSLLAESADIEAAGSHLDRPLHVAITTGNTAIAQLLIDHGADINATGYNNRTPLHLTAESDDLEIMRLLLRKGASIEAIDASGWTPLHSCTGSHGAQMLIDHGADIDHADQDGTTPLHYAILYQDVGLFMTLLRNGASTHIRTKIDGRNTMDMIEDLVDVRSRDKFLVAVKGVPSQ